MKPIVGVMPLWDEERDSIWMLPGYLDGLRQAGGIPLIFPLSSDEEELRRLMALCDGFLFTGGQDVSPSLYGEEPLEDLLSVCPMRDRMESLVFKEALRADKPILGICRGIQFINAALGGTLYQDLPSQHPSGTEHCQRPPYDEPIHDVLVIKDSPLFRLLGTERLPVNSYHHQAVKKLAPGLIIMALSPDGLIEAVHMPAKHFLWAVQWHPEYSWRTDSASRKLFSVFIRSMERPGEV